MSNAMHWCDYCKVWMQDTTVAKATHERGAKHQENVARKLRDMRKAQDSERAEKRLAEATFSSIEAQARQQYEKDKQAAAQERKKILGEWVYDEESQYYYNAVQRYYFDSESQMYYGGEPIEWTSAPSIPTDAYYPGTAPPAAAGEGTKPGLAAAGSKRPPGTVVVKRVVSVPKHPLADLGGYQMPTVGAIGGAKDLGDIGAPKRKRVDDGKGGGGGKALSKEEEEALARREAARQRVQQRTLQTFGMG